MTALGLGLCEISKGQIEGEDKVEKRILRNIDIKGKKEEDKLVKETGKEDTADAAAHPTSQGAPS